ncbi:MAG: hypothetical protein E6R03_00415 [Hyphomicrobiaceae bacterium]|nr:MAG: hypothetical protein E6R03_00415 [Hyphomicrobiaceae bacterium]
MKQVKTGITEKDILEAMQRITMVDLEAVKDGWEYSEPIMAMTTEEKKDEMPRLREVRVDGKR